MPDGTAVVGSLRGRIFILDPSGKVISTIHPKKDLGLSSGTANFKHVHNVAWTEVDGKDFLLLYAWNPAGFAVLEQVAK